MKLEITGEGWIAKRSTRNARAFAVGPRCAVLPNGDVLGTFMVQSGIGVNDFVPMASTSKDGGLTWSEAQPIWPHLQNSQSIFCSVGRAPNGVLFLYGIRFSIDSPGESFWSEASQGMKDNDLVWARWVDGQGWSDPVEIPKPIPGSAEAPGAMCITQSGRWLVCYAPYNTFDPHLIVERNQIVVLSSDDEGKSWRHTRMLHFPETNSGGAEAWVVELGAGKLLGACWQVGYTEGQEFPNPYALSFDDGETWTATQSTGIMGQSIALAALPDGRALFIYNQRKLGEPGVWLAIANPDESGFVIEMNQIVWRADQTTRHDSSGEHLEWQDFAFGEPSVTVLPDETLLVAFWCIQPSGQGIRYIKLRLDQP